jgi:hypothetical protein
MGVPGLGLVIPAIGTGLTVLGAGAILPEPVKGAIGGAVENATSGVMSGLTGNEFYSHPDRFNWRIDPASGKTVWGRGDTWKPVPSTSLTLDWKTKEADWKRDEERRKGLAALVQQEGARHGRNVGLLNTQIGGRLREAGITSEAQLRDTGMRTEAEERINQATLAQRNQEFIASLPLEKQKLLLQGQAIADQAKANMAQIELGRETLAANQGTIQAQLAAKRRSDAIGLIMSSLNNLS